MENNVLAQNKASNANTHRLTSIRDRLKQKEAEKEQIRNALQEHGNSKNPNHVTFSDSDEDNEKAVNNTTAAGNTPKAADDILGFDGDDDLNITFEQRFKSKDTEKMLELQSRYGNDSRFRLNEKFAESSESDTSDDEQDVRVEDAMAHEVKRNIQLIDQITGHLPKPRKQRPAKTFSAKSSMRYDPSTNSNMELSMTKSKISNCTKPAPKQVKKSTVTESDPAPNHDRFYDVSTDILKNAFSASKEEVKDESLPQSNTFSFIEALKLDPELEDEVAQDEEMALEAISNNNYDSSSGDDTDVDEDDNADEDNSVADEEIPMVIVPSADADKNVPVLTYSTFFPTSASDPSITQAAKNFCWNKTYEQMQKEWLEVKDILIKDYKKKHRDAKKKRSDD